MNQTFRILFILSAISLAGCAAHTSVRHHEDYQKAANDIESVVILPADVEITQINFNGDDELLEEKSNSVRQRIHSLASNKLKQENLKVIDFDFDTHISEDEDFAFAITQTKEAWQQAKADMYKYGLVSEEKKAEFQTNLGSVLNIIAEKTGADSALLIHYNGFEKSAGSVSKDIAVSILIGVLTAGAAVPVQATEGSQVEVALIDTSSGKIIWANRKPGAVATEAPAVAAFNELPDLMWETELAALTPAENLVAPSDQKEIVTSQANQ